MKRLLIVLPALALVACNQTKPVVSAPPNAAPIDAKIAKVSEELAKQCATLATVITLAKIYNTKPSIDKALTAGEAARAAFCAHPPSDVNSAISSVAAIAVSINTALQEPVQ